MPYGVYTVRQTNTVNDAAFVSDFDVFIAENGKTYEYILNNAPFKSYIHVTKIDAESGKTIPYEGAGFQIFDSENQLVNMGVDTLYTNSEGFLITPETLPTAIIHSLRCRLLLAIYWTKLPFLSA